MEDARISAAKEAFRVAAEEVMRIAEGKVATERASEGPRLERLEKRVVGQSGEFPQLGMVRESAPKLVETNVNL